MVEGFVIVDAPAEELKRSQPLALSHRKSFDAQEELKKLLESDNYQLVCRIRLGPGKCIKGMLEVTQYLVMFAPIDDSENENILSEASFPPNGCPRNA